MWYRGNTRDLGSFSHHVKFSKSLILVVWFNFKLKYLNYQNLIVIFHFTEEDNPKTCLIVSDGFGVYSLKQSCYNAYFVLTDAWHQRLLRRQPLIPSVTTMLPSWRLTGISEHISQWIQHIRALLKSLKCIVANDSQMISPRNGPVTRKMFSFDGVIMWCVKILSQEPSKLLSFTHFTEGVNPCLTKPPLNLTGGWVGLWLIFLVN